MAQATDLVTPLNQSSVRMRFHEGKIQNNQPLLDPNLPNMPGDVSPWYISQWNQNSYIFPNPVQANDPNTYDPVLGIAKYAFASADGHAHVWIYQNNGVNTYELYETGGTLINAGGSNLFLTTDKMTPGSFGRPLTVDFDAKLSKALITGTPEALQNGIVLSQVFAGFGLMFTDPQTRAQQFVFLQIGISATRGGVSRTAQFICGGNNTVALFGPNMNNNEVILPYQSDLGPLHHFHYDMNRYLNDLLNTTSCNARWTANQKNPANWTLSGVYIGLETEAADARNGTVGPPQGVLETGFQIANLRLQQH
jgi:hypothetical protein